MKTLHLGVSLIIIIVGCSVPERENQDLLPYLQMPTDSSMSVLWRTSTEQDGRLEFGLTPQMVNEVYDPTPVQRHRVTLDGLYSHTQYYYRVFSNGVPVGDLNTFRTAPIGTVPFRFAVLGDTQETCAVKGRLRDGIMNDEVSFILHVGDLASEYGGYRESDWRLNFFNDFSSLLVSAPIMPVLGNHEYQVLNNVVIPSSALIFHDYFYLPNNERWYAFNWANCHFIALDVNIFGDLTKGGKLYNWLIHDLEETNDRVDDPDHIFVFWHQPCFSSGLGQLEKVSGSLRRIYVPLLESFNVDVVFCGHDQFFERSWKEGIYYFVVGGGGCHLHHSIPNFNPYSQVVHVTHHYLRVSVDGQFVLIEAVDEDGLVIDSVILD